MADPCVPDSRLCQAGKSVQFCLHGYPSKIIPVQYQEPDNKQEYLHLKPRLEKIVESRLDRKAIGFNTELGRREDKDISELLQEVTPHDLVKFGLIPEFVGRVPICVSLRGLDREALIRILQEPKNALVKQYQKLFQMDNVELSFEQDAIEAIADKALERKTGARGLRSIMESVMMDTMYEIPSDDTIEECVVTKAAVDGESEPLTIHDESLKKAK